MASGPPAHPSLSPTSPTHSPSAPSQSPSASTHQASAASAGSTGGSSSANNPPSSGGSGTTWTDPPWCGWIETTLDALLILEAARRGLIPRVTRRLVDAERRMIASGAVFVFDEDESGIKRWTDGFFWSPSRILGNFLLYRETDKRGSGHRGRGKSNNASSGDAGASASASAGAADVSGSGSELLVPSPHHQQHYGGSPKVDPGSSAGSASASLSRPKGENSSLGVDKHRERTLVGSLTNSYKFKPDGMMKKTFSLSINGTSQHLISYYKVADVEDGRLRTPSSLPELASLDISPEYLDKTHFRNPPRVEYDENGRPRYRGEGEEGERGTGVGTGVGASTSAMPSGTTASNATTHLLGAPVPPASGGAYAGAYGYGGYSYSSASSAPPIGSLGSPTLLDSSVASGTATSGSTADVHSQQSQHGGGGHHHGASHHEPTSSKRSKRYDPYPPTSTSGSGEGASTSPSMGSTSAPGPKRARKKTSSNSNPSPTAESPTVTSAGGSASSAGLGMPSSGGSIGVSQQHHSQHQQHQHQQQASAQMYLQSPASAPATIQSHNTYTMPSAHIYHQSGHTYYQPHPYSTHPLSQQQTAYGGYTYPHPGAHTPSPTVTAATPPPPPHSAPAQATGVPSPADGQSGGAIVRHVGTGPGPHGSAYTFYTPPPPPQHTHQGHGGGGASQYTYLPMDSLGNMVGGMGGMGQAQGEDDEREDDR